MLFKAHFSIFIQILQTFIPEGPGSIKSCFVQVMAGHGIDHTMELYPIEKF